MGRASTESCSLGSQGALVLRFIVLASCITLLVVLFMGHDGGKVSSSSSSATKEVIHFTVANLSPKDSHIRPVIPPRAAVDLGLNKEGIRLELAKTSKTFNSGFCDVLVDPQDFTPAGGGEDGGAVCSAARLYLADNKDDKSDRILDFAMKHESNIIDLFTGLLSASTCKPLQNGRPYLCGSGLTDRIVKGRRVIAADYGANAGFYTQLSARLGYPVVAVEPQPHCAHFIHSASAMNGVSDRVTLHTGYLAKDGRTADGATHLTVRTRSGCFGTWPYPESTVVREHWNQFQGGNGTTEVPMFDPASLISDSDLVLLLKVDTEGHEVDILRAMEPHLKAGRVLNIIVELNKRRFMPEGEMAYDVNQPEKWKTADGPYIELMTWLVDLGYAAMPGPEMPWGGEAAITTAKKIAEFVRSGWIMKDVWFALDPTRVQ